MLASQPFAPGNYHYLPAVFQYSGGVAADEGYQIERVRLQRSLPLGAGFELIAARLRDLGRPLTAFCHCELRSPAPFTEDGFQTFNRSYVEILQRWGIMQGDVNPVARSNVCPAFQPPREVQLYAFSYTVPASGSASRTFVIAGSGEAPEGKANYRDHIVRRGDTSPEALHAKASWVLGEQQRRLESLGFAWSDVTAAQVYCVHDIHPLLEPLLLPRGAASTGIHWQFCRPPVVEIEFEMDCRGIERERVHRPALEI